MKKQLLLSFFVIFLFLINITATHAQTDEEATSQPTPTSKTETIKDKIEDLKERLATRVAELRSKNKRGYYGVVKTKDDDDITIVASDREIPMLTDENTSYFTLDSSNKKKETTSKDIKLGAYIAAFGSLDLDQKTLIAKVIISHEMPRKINGVVKEVDVNEGTFSVINSKSNTYIFDYEITSRCRMLGKNFELTNCGLSKIKAEDRVFIRALAKDATIDRLKAVRILLVPATSTITPSP